METFLSNRPGRRRAESRMSILFVAAMTTTPELPVKPSISARIWFSVCSLSSLGEAKPPEARDRPMESISSMKMMQGATFLASLKRSLTLDAPTPTKTSTKEEPEVEKKGTPASPATARAINVFPVPGGPSMMTPLGIFAPNFVNCPGFFRNVTTSFSSCLASSCPATFSNVTPVLGDISNLAPDFPNCPMPGGPPAPPIPRVAKSPRPPMNSQGRMFAMNAPNALVLTTGWGLMENSTLWSLRVFSMSGSEGMPPSWNLSPLTSMAVSDFPSAEKRTDSIWSASTLSRN
mmetsp:Transcript_30920/g.60920  ORF Transcript_30920/g.60920 Transcript_30920/m.60920 type:complete len:290 (-) Transcript_30920:540-1409(-)